MVSRWGGTIRRNLSDYSTEQIEELSARIKELQGGITVLRVAGRANGRNVWVGGRRFKMLVFPPPEESALLDRRSTRHEAYFMMEYIEGVHIDLRCGHVPLYFAAGRATTQVFRYHSDGAGQQQR